MRRELLSDSVEQFLTFRRSQDYSANTIRTDRGVLKRLLASCGNIYCNAITEKHVSRYFEEIGKTRAPSTQRNDHNTLNRFFAWARHTGRMPVDSNPMFGRRSPRPTKKERNRVPVHEFPRLLEAAEARDPRDRALIALFLYTLMRDGEVTSLRVRDLDLQGGWLSARIHKTRQEDRMPVSAELDEEMRRWLTHYTSVVGPLEPGYVLVPPRITNPIFGPDGKIQRHGAKYRPEHHITDTARLVKVTLKSIDFPLRDSQGKSLNEGAHTIRRSGARAMFDELVASGYDHALRIVQSMLHHSSVTMTESYLGITADRRSRDDIVRGQRIYNTNRSNVVSIAR